LHKGLLGESPTLGKTIVLLFVRTKHEGNILTFCLCCENYGKKDGEIYGKNDSAKINIEV